MQILFGRGPDRKKRKSRRPSYVSRFLGPNRAKYTDSQRNLRLARQAYLQGEPGLLEKWGIISNRRASMSQLSSIAAFNYTRTRYGRRELVRQSPNRFKFIGKRGRARVSARLSIPFGRSEVYALGVGSVTRDRRNIKEKFKSGMNKKGVGLSAQGNLGPLQARVKGYAGLR